MSNHNHHNHNHHHNFDKNKLFITFLLNISILVVQVIGGLVSGSMALLSDALHNFSDATAIAATYFANKIAQRPKNIKYTFGYKRLELLAAIFNSLTLIIMSVLLIKEAIELAFVTRKVDTNIMILAATFGIIANTIGTYLLHKDADKNMNIKSAYLHLFSDIISSLIVVIGAIFIKIYNINWIDLVLSIVLALYMIFTSWRIILNSTRIFLMRAPKELDLEKIISDIQNNFNIKNIHHVHCWQMDENNTHLEFHAEFNSNNLEDITPFYDKIEEYLHQKYEITHLTIQAETSRCNDKTIVNDTNSII